MIIVWTCWITLAGKQWGARYLLVVAPLSACVAALALETLRTRERRWLLLSGSVVFGLW